MKNISNHSKCYRRIPVRKTLQTSTRNKLVSNDLYPQTRYTHLIKRYMSSDQDNITRLAISEDLNNKIYKYYRALPGGEHVGTYTYEQKHLKNGNETVWTCYFQCPITGYKIYSGYIHPDLRKVVFGDDSTNIKWIQGKVYYSKKNHARRAAAALTMDCLGISSDVVEQYSNGLDSYNFCLETLPIDLPSKIQQASDADGNPISSMERKQSSYGELDSSLILSKELGTRLNIFVQDRYENIGKSLKNAYEFESKTFDCDGKECTAWTCCFICPLSEKKIFSGGVKPEYQHSIFGRNIEFTLHESQKTFYLNKEDAKRACDAMIIDSMTPKDVSDFHMNECSDTLCVGESSKIIGESINRAMQEIENSITSDGNRRCFDALEALAKLHRLYNPRDLRLSIINEGITYSSCESFGKNVWTAEFKSPITEEVFPAGVLKSEDSLHIAGKTYYVNKRLARAAAVGLATDCFHFRGGWLTNRSGKEFQFPVDNVQNYTPFCLDSPYESKDGLSCVFDVFIPAEKSNQISITPKQIMNNRYQKLFRGTGSSINEESFSSVSTDVDVNGIKHVYWNSTFECPVTGQVFSSGTLKIIDENASETDVPQLLDINGTIYYLEKKNAEHAAAGRAYDILSSTNFFSSFGMNEYKEIPQFCHEDPHDTLNVDNDEDEFTIQTIPTAGGLNKESFTTQTTMEIVLDAWADAKIDAVHTDDSQSSGLVADAVDVAGSWSKKMNEVLKKGKSQSICAISSASSKSLKALNHSPITTFSCNAILKALANCNNGAFSADTHRVQSIAKDVIELMGELSSPPTSLPCIPNVDTFNFYIRCLQSTKAVEVSEKAEAILSDMIDKKKLFGVQLPNPDCNTFNAVMKSWLSVSEVDHYEEAQRLFHKLESNGLHPNKDTFKIMLEALGQTSKHSSQSEPTFFKGYKARSLIHKMDEYSKKDTYQDLNVDIETFNLALNVHNIYDEILHKDDAGTEKFDEHFDPTDVLVLNALNVENWVNEIEQNHLKDDKASLNPNLSTYEAVMKAWIQTCSIEGMLNAEKWAQYLLDKSMDPDSGFHLRLSTFLPIIKAWAFSGHELGVVKVDNWIRVIDELSNNNHCMKPDLNMRSLYIEALKRKQYQLLKTFSCPFPEALQISTSCMEIASNLSHQAVERSESDYEMFLMLIDLWKYNLEFLQLESSEFEIMVQNMCSVMDLYEDTFGFRKMLKLDQFDQISNPHEVLYGSDQIYEKIISSILDLGDENETLQVAIIESQVHKIEGYLNRREQYRNRIASDYGGTCDNIPIMSTILLRNIIRCCKFMKNKTRNGDAVRIAVSVLHYVIEQQEQDTISESDALLLYHDVVDMVETVVFNPIEKTMVVKAIISDLMKLNQSVLDSFADIIANYDVYFPSDNKSDSVKETRKNLSKRKRARRKTRAVDY
jgi:transcription elongation factor Elf1